ncbi:MAG: hypothetical protein JST86_11915 [Bacteroidetes bacterium]|nr:hypothetical protein [Bacteroidota bacterium]
MMLVAACMAVLPVTAQKRFNDALLDTLEHIAAQETPAKYFAQLYHGIIEKTNDYAATLPDSVQRFVFRFESLFAPFFFQSYNKYIHHEQPDAPWVRYFDSVPKNPLQYMFIGMNAHINGDMCLALVNQFSYDTIKKYRVPLLHFQSVLNAYFDSVYTGGWHYHRVCELNLLSFGADRQLGKYMISHWRKRQERLALLYYSHPLRYQRKNKRLVKKMQSYDVFALKWIR